MFERGGLETILTEMARLSWGSSRMEAPRRPAHTSWPSESECKLKKKLCLGHLFLMVHNMNVIHRCRCHIILCKILLQKLIFFKIFIFAETTCLSSGLKSSEFWSTWTWPPAFLLFFTWFSALTWSIPRQVKTCKLCILRAIKLTLLPTVTLSSS